MNDAQVLAWAAPAAISAIGLLISIISLVRVARADARATRADDRLERIERLERVQLEVRRAPNSPNLYRLFNVGTDAVEDVAIDPVSVLNVTFQGQRSALVLEPTEYMTFTMDTPDGVRVPVSLRVTWSAPFQGERRVPLPADPDEPWTAAIWS